MDVFDDEVEPDTSRWHEKQHEARHQDGYRRGLDVGYERTLQPSFNTGYCEAFELCFKCAYLRGTLTALLGDRLTSASTLIPDGSVSKIEQNIEQLSGLETALSKLKDRQSLSETDSNSDAATKLSEELATERPADVKSSGVELTQSMPARSLLVRNTPDISGVQLRHDVSSTDSDGDVTREPGDNYASTSKTTSSIRTVHDVPQMSQNYAFIELKTQTLKAIADASKVIADLDMSSVLEFLNELN